MTRVLVCSTYELGAQPLGCAVPAAVLVDAGHEVRVVDLSLDELGEADLAWADAVAFSVPMHTGLRLGLQALATVRSARAEVRVAFFGLYAHVAHTPGRFQTGDLICVDSDALLAWANEAAGSVGQQRDASANAVVVALSTRSTRAARVDHLPRRDGLPGLDRYARLIGHGPDRLVGSIETTTGCNHRCRHCPVPVVFAGRSYPLDEAVIAADVDQVVALGATHVHFADPDFFNRPAHARRVVDLLHERHRSVTFDATIKVSHILRHAPMFSEFADKGLLFVISAFESTSATVLERLDKGHSPADLARAVEILRGAEIEPRPSLLPFTPWTTRADVVELFDFVARHDLIANVDPVQYAIRLLLPPGSLLLADPDPVLAAALGDLDPEGIARHWHAADPVLDDLAEQIAACVEAAAATNEETMTTYGSLRALVHRVLDIEDGGVPSAIGTKGPRAESRPRLSEAWFCCAEPTAKQRAVIGGTA